MIKENIFNLGVKRRNLLSDNPTLRDAISINTMIVKMANSRIRVFESELNGKKSDDALYYTSLISAAINPQIKFDIFLNVETFENMALGEMSRFLRYVLTRDIKTVNVKLVSEELLNDIQVLFPHCTQFITGDDNMFRMQLANDGQECRGDFNFKDTTTTRMLNSKFDNAEVYSFKLKDNCIVVSDKVIA